MDWNLAAFSNLLSYLDQTPEPEGEDDRIGSEQPEYGQRTGGRAEEQDQAEDQRDCANQQERPLVFEQTPQPERGSQLEQARHNGPDCDQVQQGEDRDGRLDEG